MTTNERRILAELLLAQKYEEVIARTGEVLERSPLDASVHNIRALAFTHLKNYREGAKHFETVSQLAPKEDAVWGNLFFCLSELGEHKELSLAALRLFQAVPSVSSGLFAIEHALKFPDLYDDAKRIFMRMFGAKFPPGSKADAAITTYVPLRDWCATNRASITEIDPAQDIEIKDALTGEALTYTSAPTSVAILSDAKSVCGWDFVIASTGEVIEDTGYLSLRSKMVFMPHVINSEARRVALMWPDNAELIEDDTLFLSCPAEFAFGHWLLDFLPRLLALRTENGRALKIYCPGSLPPHLKEALTLFGIRDEDIIGGVLGKMYHFKKLTVCQVGKWIAPSLHVTRYIYAAFGPPPGYRPNSKERRIFLERSQTNRGRYVANTIDFAQVLSEFSIETMRRPEVSIGDQNKILWDTGIVVVAYGTDILSCYQLRPGTDIVVFYFNDLEALTTDGELDIAFTRLCAILGLRLHRFFCGAPEDDKRADYKRDLIVDCARLRQILQAITERRAAEAAL